MKSINNIGMCIIAFSAGMIFKTIIDVGILPVLGFLCLGVLVWLIRRMYSRLKH